MPKRLYRAIQNLPFRRSFLRRLTVLLCSSQLPCVMQACSTNCQIPRLRLMVTDFLVLVVGAFLIFETSHVNAMSMAKSSILSASEGVPVFVTNKMCPYAQKGWIALEASGIKYDFKEISLYGPGGKPDWFWDLNPKGTVPVLVSREGNEKTVYADSDLILDFVATLPQSPKSILSSGPSETQHSQSFRRLLNGLLPVAKKSILGRRGEDEMWRKLQEMDKLVKGPYICGDHLSVADCAAFPFLWRLDSEYGSLKDFDCPNIDTWLATCQKIPQFKKTIQSAWWWWW